MHKHNTQIMVQVRNMVNTTQNSKLNRIKHMIISEMQLTVYMSTVIHDVQQHKNCIVITLPSFGGMVAKTTTINHQTNPFRIKVKASIVRE